MKITINRKVGDDRLHYLETSAEPNTLHTQRLRMLLQNYCTDGTPSESVAWRDVRAYAFEYLENQKQNFIRIELEKKGYRQMKIIELKIERVNGEIKISGKSEVIGKYVQDCIRRQNSLPEDAELPIGRIPSIHAYWSPFEYYRTTTNFMEGLTFNLERAIVLEGLACAPWLMHKNLRTGFEVKYLQPCSSVACRNYAERVKNKLNEFFEQHLSPFEITVEIIKGEAPAEIVTE